MGVREQQALNTSIRRDTFLSTIMPEGKEDFVVFENLTLSQSLQVLYNIATFRCENFEERASEKELKINDLVKIYRLFDDLQGFINDGITRIEKFYKHRLLESMTDEKDLKYKYEDLQILGQKVRLSKRECNRRIEALERDKKSQRGAVRGMFMSLTSKKCQSRVENEKEEEAAIEAAEKLKACRARGEMRHERSAERSAARAASFNRAENNYSVGRDTMTDHMAPPAARSPVTRSPSTMSPATMSPAVMPPVNPVPRYSPATAPSTSTSPWETAYPGGRATRERYAT